MLNKEMAKAAIDIIKIAKTPKSQNIIDHGLVREKPKAQSLLKHNTCIRVPIFFLFFILFINQYFSSDLGYNNRKDANIFFSDCHFYKSGSSSNESIVPNSI